jgi:hypothetical protein
MGAIVTDLPDGGGMKPRSAAGVGSFVQAAAVVLLACAGVAVGAGALALGTVARRSPGSSPLPEARADEPARRSPAGNGVAVVELFTSEGCSSCPPADAVLAELAGDPRVFALSFHVDYWDELGWPDRFASPEATSRQRVYAAAFGARGLYTPQLVVGGTDGFTGSDRARASTDVAAALAHPPLVALKLHPRGGSGARLLVDYEAPEVPQAATIVVAVVERAAITFVRAGENAGRTLHHVGVVRSFASQAAASTGTVPVRWPASLRRADGEIVAFVQHPGDEKPGMPVIAAARAELPSSQ